MNIIQTIQNAVVAAVQELYDIEIAPNDVIIAPTRREFEGDYTVTVFNFAKLARKAPPQVGQEIGAYLSEKEATFPKFNVIQGFLNLSVTDALWTDFVVQNFDNPQFGQLAQKNTRVMVEFSSPNTNKPLHLGHIRNNLLGWSISKIYEAAGFEVVRTQVINDRGIAICKSMLAWQHFGGGKTPDTEGVKGDHFVGDYYVLFEQKFKEEYANWQKTETAQSVFESRKKTELIDTEFFKEYKNDYFNKHSALGAEAREMLLKWENNDPSVVELWKTMNGWVYSGFSQTYEKLGVRFDKNYYESNQYTVGKDIIEDGITRGVFYQKPDTSVWIDLTAAKLDHKLVLRSDGTSVYITQDIGMARLREADFACRKVIYVVADEQNYHFQVLFETLKKLGEPYSDGLFHLSYGMVELPTGRMKSREGTVVDADDLIAEVIKIAKNEAEERNSVINELPNDRRDDAIRRIGIAALKYDLIKVNPKKKMIFNPEESVSFEGHTGPYIQYAFVRSSGVVRDALAQGVLMKTTETYSDLKGAEKDLAQKIYAYPKTIEEAATNYDPSIIANYVYDLAKGFNRFWHDCSILNESDATIRAFRLQLSQLTAHTLQQGMSLLGIEMPERM